ncbi:acetate--CoA ligase family protein [Vitreimonas sp.]|uniref:acetate--CoA ligase family protein n=1 Tax=Vitreimonas sp. TaxID=3069702 RepID=UPI002ED8E688
MRKGPVSLNLDRLLSPRSVAIVGASASPGALGASVLDNLVRGGFEGEIYLINPKRAEIGGRLCIGSIDELPDGVDAAVLAIPKAGVLEAVEALARKRVGGAVIFSAGFAEGGAEGFSEQKSLATTADDAGMALLGPNCLGFVNNVAGVALTFVQTPAAQLKEGRCAALVSQSGAMAAVLCANLAAKDVGVTLSVSTGNEASSGVEDYLSYVLEHGRADVIGMIVEQFRDPPRFLELARAARAAGKSIVLLHPGRSAAARLSAATHTGAMAGDYSVMRALTERAGIIVAETVEELSDLIEIVVRGPSLRSSGVAILTESGAFKALSLDLAESVGLSLPALSDADAPALRAALPGFVPVSNPVDLTAQALVDPGLYGRAIAALCGDDRIGAIVLGIIQTDTPTCDLKLPAIIDALERSKPTKPIIYSGLDDGAPAPAHYLARLRALGASALPSAERAIRALARLAVQKPTVRAGEPAKSIAINLPARSGVIAEHQSKAILRAIRLPCPEGRLATSAEAAADAAEALGFPVVFKAQSSALSHKSDAGGVTLNIASRAEAVAAWESILANVKAYDASIKLDGVLVERMGARGIEMILGARRDPAWGPVLLIGFGGVQAEALRDFRVLAPDLSDGEFVSEILKLRAAPLLTGFRGAPPAAIEDLAALAVRLGALMLQEPRIAEIDLNPVVVHPRGQGISVLDALMSLEGPR